MNANLVEIQNQEEQNWIHSMSNSRSKSILLFEMQIDRISIFTIYRYGWLVVAFVHDFFVEGGSLARINLYYLLLKEGPILLSRNSSETIQSRKYLLYDV